MTRNNLEELRDCCRANQMAAATAANMTDDPELRRAMAAHAATAERAVEVIERKLAEMTVVDLGERRRASGGIR